MSENGEPRAPLSRAATYVKGGGLVLAVLGVVAALGNGSLSAGLPLLICALLVIVIGELMDIRHSIDRRG